MMSYYPYRFVMNYKGGVDDPYAQKTLYTFNSPRSHQGYMVWVEEYEHHFYAIKFHLRKDKNNKDRYSVMTGLGEARPVINTCIRIMLDIANRDELSSFGFIGASMLQETTINTKRFRVYRRIMATYVSEEHFEHRFNIKKSTYILLRRQAMKENPNLEHQIQEKFIQLYPYFE